MKVSKGEPTKKLSVTAHSFSKSAVEKIEAAGGTVMRLRERKPTERKKKQEATAPVAETDEPEDEAPEAEEPEAAEPAGDEATES